MGSSIYHVGWQPTYYNVPTEVRVLSDAYNECRRLALGRLLEEAQYVRRRRRARRAHRAGRARLGARRDRVHRRRHRRAASAGDARPATAATVLSDLSGQEFVQLCEAGMRPVGIAAHTSIHYVPASGQTQMAQSQGWGSSWVNQELVDFSQGVYEAREKAMGLGHRAGARARRRRRDRRRAAASTVARTRSGARMLDSKDLEVTFHVMGTVVREDPTLAAGSRPRRCKSVSLR